MKSFCIGEEPRDVRGLGGKREGIRMGALSECEAGGRAHFVAVKTNLRTGLYEVFKAQVREIMRIRSAQQQCAFFGEAWQDSTGVRSAWFAFSTSARVIGNALSIIAEGNTMWERYDRCEAAGPIEQFLRPPLGGRCWLSQAARQDFAYYWVSLPEVHLAVRAP